MTSNGMEEYYQKVIHLQEKLRQSEEERLKLEMKFNEMLQTMKEEEQVHFKKLRTKYKQFLEEDRRRQQRNDKILEALDRIENRTVVWEAKTEKFKTFRRRYNDYFKQAGGGRNRSSPERPSEPKHDYHRETPYSDKQKEFKEDDTKDDIMEKYLQSLSSQKCRDELSQRKPEKPPPEAKYSNLGNINSIYWKTPTSGEKTDLEKIDPYDSTQIKNTKDMENALKQNTTSAPIAKSYEYSDFKTGRFMDDLDKPLDRYHDLGKQPSSDTFSKPADNNDYKFTPSAYGELFNDRRPSQQQEKPKQTPQQVHDELERILQQQNNEISNKPSSINLKPQEKPLPVPEQQMPIQKIQPIPRQVQPIPRQVPPRPLVPNESVEAIKSTQELSRETVHPRPIDSFEKSSLPGDIPRSEPNNQSETQLLESRADKPEPKVEIEKEVRPKIDDAGDHTHNESAIIKEYLADQPLEKQPEDVNAQELSNSTDQQGDTTEQYPQQYYEETGQPLQQYDETGQPLAQYDENGQPIQQYYDESGQLQSQYYDDNGQPLQQYYDDGQPMQQYDELGQSLPQYDKNGQPLTQYDPNTALLDQNIQPQYDENGQPIVQYDENGQLLMQYDPNMPAQLDQSGQLQYDETGQPIVQYDENGQPIYDTNTQAQLGQTVQPQYDESGQPIVQYDENGQVIAPYDQGGQAIAQYDENGQPIPQYDQTGQPLPQYDENGQPLQQYYDENGQPVQYYGGGEAAQQYDDNGQPIQQQYADQPYEDQQQYYEQDAGQIDQQETRAQQEEPPKAEAKSNVLDILDTDTESTKQETKISNDSDFDFSNG